MKAINSITVIGALLLLVNANVASAQDTVSPQSWMDALEVSGIPSDILFAMSLRESGTTFKKKRDFAPWPWVLNVGYVETEVIDGEEVSSLKHKAHYFKSREEAAKALAIQVAAGNEHVAVGMYQIYLKYNGHRVDNVLDLLDPTVNLRIAAEVLRDCGKRHKTVDDRLSCYYSGDVDEAGVGYADGVKQLAKQYAGHMRSARVSVTALKAPESVLIEDHDAFLALISNRQRVSVAATSMQILVGDAQ